MIITKKQARQFILAYQGLLPPHQLRTKGEILDFVRRVGCIQYDPLDMVGSNPNLVLQSRVRGYQPALLEELLYTQRRLVEGWDKNAAIYAVEDWPYFSRTGLAPLRATAGKSPSSTRCSPRLLRS